MKPPFYFFIVVSIFSPKQCQEELEEKHVFDNNSSILVLEPKSPDRESLLSSLIGLFGQNLDSVLKFMDMREPPSKPEDSKHLSKTFTYSKCKSLDENICFSNGLDHLECGVPNRNGRILNGTAADENEYPWMVGIFLNHGRYRKLICGGVLISDKYVLTAAHCIRRMNANNILLSFGDHDKSTFGEINETFSRISNILTHPSYVEQSYYADIALLQLKKRLTLTRQVRPVCLPTVDKDYDDKIGTVIGWGRVKWGGDHSNILMVTQVPIMGLSECRTLSLYSSGEIKSNMICAGYFNGTKDACEGDSGGPLTVMSETKQSLLIGLVSWGQECGREGYPGIYTRVSSFLDWIELNTRDSCFCNGSVSSDVKKHE